MRMLAISFLKWLQMSVLLPLTVWLADLDIAPQPARAYTEPNAFITPLILLQAMGDEFEAMKQQPEQSQGELNALMECARGKFVSDHMGFVGTLVPQYGPEEAMTRCIANILHIGMFLERRLRSVDWTPPLTAAPGIRPISVACNGCAQLLLKEGLSPVFFTQEAANQAAVEAGWKVEFEGHWCPVCTAPKGSAQS